MNVLILKGCLFVVLLIFAALWDLRKREIPDTIVVLILSTGFLAIQPWNAVVGFITTGLPYVLAAVFIKKDSGFSMGGGDIKLMAACGFVLGITFGTLHSIISLTMALLFGLCLKCHDSKNRIRTMTLPLAPFFCAGGIFSYIAFYLMRIKN
ncbi:prepilin peptidase [Acetivibrio cellulolyticus]|uniref:prepilin peptidase n=1 Tax=Acetivibrio cellulolyticus TaxID=35830 RepID=UPI0001E2C766|nr:A24 family peptidase [Acetivibrio cellulolyticus]